MHGPRSRSGAPNTVQLPVRQLLSMRLMRIWAVLPVPDGTPAQKCPLPVASARAARLSAPLVQLDRVSTSRPKVMFREEQPGRWGRRWAI